MKTLTRPHASSNRVVLMAGTCAALALAAMCFAGHAQARDNLSFSIGIGVPGVLIGATNAYPVYSPPQPVYVQPAPVYYSRPPVYVVPQPVYYGRPPGWQGRHHKRHDERRGGGYYQQAPQGYGPGYGQVNYQR